jgi:hypothetical protein
MSSRVISLERWLHSWGVVGTIWGNYPIQGEWNLPGGMWAYFRARHENWELSIWAHPPRSEESLPHPHAEIWCHRGRQDGANLGALTPDAASEYVWRGFLGYLRHSGVEDVYNQGLLSEVPPWSKTDI